MQKQTQKKIGYYAGLSLDGNVLSIKDNVNIDFYGEKVATKKIAEGMLVLRYF